MCSTSNGSATHCLSTARSTADVVFPALFPDLNGTQPRSVLTPSTLQVKSLLSAALTLQSQIFIPLLAGAGLLFLAGLVLLALLKRSPDSPRAELLRACATGTLCLSTALSFTAALSTSQTAGALQYSSRLSGAAGDAQVVTRPGMALQVLQWLAFGFSLLFSTSVPWLLRGGRGGGGEKV